MNIQPVTAKKQAMPVIGWCNMPVINWCELSEVQAIIELCTRLNIGLRVNDEGKLSATGNTGAIPKYLSDITDRYRGAVIAHLLDLPAPEVTDQQDSLNIAAIRQALDMTIAEYCAVTGQPQEYRDRLLLKRREMAPAQLVQDLCAFRAWLYAANLRGGGDD